MRKDRDLSQLFARGQAFEASLVASDMYKNDGGKHYLGYKIKHSGNKHTVVDCISVYGNTILILEAKNFKYISGNYNDSSWTGAGRNNRQFRFMNPINQNSHHVSVLIKHLRRFGILLSSYSIVPYVVVPDTCEIDIDDRSSAYVINESQVRNIKNGFARRLVEHPQLAEVMERGMYGNL